MILKECLATCFVRSTRNIRSFRHTFKKLHFPRCITRIARVQGSEWRNALGGCASVPEIETCSKVFHKYHERPFF